MLAFSSKDIVLPKNSRAARRVQSPSLDVDKSLKDDSIAGSDARGKYAEDALSAQHRSGVIKKSKQKPIKRNQRLRREKGVERAEMVAAQLENKVIKSRDKNKAVKGRRAAWEDLNGAVQPPKHKKTAGRLQQDADHEMMKGNDTDGDGLSKETHALEGLPTVQTDISMPGQDFLEAAGKATDLDLVS